MPNTEISYTPALESLPENEGDWFKPFHTLKKSTKSRIAAVLALCEADLSDHDPLEVLLRLDIYKSLSSHGAQHATKVVNYVKEQQRYLDNCIEQYVHRGMAHEMPLTDRNIIRVAFAESHLTPVLQHSSLIKESMAIAETIGSDRSAAFVNALLCALLEGRQSNAPYTHN